MPRGSIEQIALVGFGEVGGIFGNDFARRGIAVSVFDILLLSERYRKQMRAKAHACRVKATDNLRNCVHDAELVISAVTASSALTAAKQASRILGPGQLFLDINSVSPETKRKIAAQIERGRGTFVEAAVMAGVPGPRLKVPMLLGGAHALVVAERLRAIGMNATALSDQIGVASAVKMCRSVMMKGMEALAVECLFAARRYGAEDAVLTSLAETYPTLGWDNHLPDYLISRVAQHGSRRAAEMREVARALKAVGVRPTMAPAIAQRQEQLVEEMEQARVRVESDAFSWRSLADALLAAEPPKPARSLPNKLRRARG